MRKMKEINEMSKLFSEEVAEFLSLYGVEISKTTMQFSLTDEIKKVIMFELNKNQFKRNVMYDVFQKSKGCNIKDFGKFIEEMEIDERWKGMPNWAIENFEVRYNDHWENISFYWLRDYNSINKIKRMLNENISLLEWFFEEGEMKQIKLESLFGGSKNIIKYAYGVEEKLRCIERELEQNQKYEKMNGIIISKIDNFYDTVRERLKNEVM